MPLWKSEPHSGKVGSGSVVHTFAKQAERQAHITFLFGLCRREGEVCAGYLLGTAIREGLTDRLLLSLPLRDLAFTYEWQEQSSAPRGL